MDTSSGGRGPRLDWLGGNTGVAMRMVLLVLYLYLFFLGYTMMGVLGLFLITALFLVALYSPVLYEMVMKSWKKRSAHIFGSKQ